jgi:hypothetical protein
MLFFKFQQIGYLDIGSGKITRKIGKIQGKSLEIEEIIWNNFRY